MLSKNQHILDGHCLNISCLFFYLNLIEIFFIYSPLLILQIHFFSKVNQRVFLGSLQKGPTPVFTLPSRSLRVTAASRADGTKAHFAGLNAITWYMAEIWRFRADAQISVALEYKAFFDP